MYFHENSVVELNNGEQKSINEIVKGDILKNGSKVQCVVKTLCFEGKSKFVHTLNGSALAAGRALIAIIENNFDQKSKISIPEVLQDYTKFSHIEVW